MHEETLECEVALKWGDEKREELLNCQFLPLLHTGIERPKSSELLNLSCWE